MAKYPEVNAQHKKMLRVHDLIAEASEAGGDGPPRSRRAQEDLWRGQSNDTYWHGLFGGIYMTDVRTRVHGHLLRAEQAAERVLYGTENWLNTRRSTSTCDLMQELLIEGKRSQPLHRARAGRLDIRRGTCAITITRSARSSAAGPGLPSGLARVRGATACTRGKAGSEAAGEGLSPHENIRVKEEGLDRYLHYDAYQRNSMVDHFIGPGTTLNAYVQGRYNEEGDFIYGAYKAELETIGQRHPACRAGARRPHHHRDGTHAGADQQAPDDQCGFAHVQGPLYNRRT